MGDRMAAAGTATKRDDQALLQPARCRLAEERLRVRRCLDDLRHAEQRPIKRRRDRPVLYAITAAHAAFLRRSASGWLPLAWRAYRAAQADLRLLEAQFAEQRRARAAELAVAAELAGALRLAAE